MWDKKKVTMRESTNNIISEGLEKIIQVYHHEERLIVEEWLTKGKPETLERVKEEYKELSIIEVMIQTMMFESYGIIIETEIQILAFMRTITKLQKERS